MLAQADLDTLNASLSRVKAAMDTHAKAEADEAIERAAFAATLQSLGGELAEGDMRTLGAAVTCIVKEGGVVKYRIVPGFLDADAAAAAASAPPPPAATTPAPPVA